jgi:ketosteroid isomerase-like protein
MTSSENMDLVRSIYAEWERGDFSSAAWAHTEIEWVVADGPSPGRWTGVAGMKEASRDWVNAWEGYHVQARQFRALDDGRVLVLFDLQGRGRTSGVELGRLGSKAAGVFHIRGGKVTRLVAWWDRGHALADLSLENEGDAG